MLHRPHCHITYHWFPDVVLVRGHGDFESTAAFELGIAVNRAARAGHRAVVVSLADVRRFGAIGLAAALDMAASAARLGVVATMVAPPQRRIELLVLARLATCLDLYVNEGHALAACEWRPGKKTTEGCRQRAA